VLLCLAVQASILKDADTGVHEEEDADKQAEEDYYAWEGRDRICVVFIIHSQ